jgi:hypothetical protein
MICAAPPAAGVANGFGCGNAAMCASGSSAFLSISARRRLTDGLPVCRLLLPLPNMCHRPRCSFRKPQGQALRAQRFGTQRRLVPERSACLRCWFLPERRLRGVCPSPSIESLFVLTHVACYSFRSASTRTPTWSSAEAASLTERERTAPQSTASRVLSASLVAASFVCRFSSRERLRRFR